MLLMVTLGGCIADNYNGSDGEAGGKPIKFTPAVSTRATTGHPIERGANIPADNSFGVYAYSKLTPASSVVSYDALENMKVTSDGTDFTYSPVARWPMEPEAKLLFYGYYPWKDQTGSPASDDPSINVTMGAQDSPSMTISYITPAEPSKQVDLMYACTGMTGGFEPVKVDFGHALTRINFKAQVKDYAQAVRITSVSISGVKTQGRLTVTDNTTSPVWNGLVGDAVILQTAVNGLADRQLGNSPVPVTAIGGDLLLLPQLVQGMTLQVEATLNGVPFNNSFTFSLTGTPDWKMNEIVTYEITISGSGMTLNAKVSDWNERHVEVIEDGQWWMLVDKDELDFSPGSGQKSLTFKTNYRKEDVSISVPANYSGWLSTGAPSQVDTYRYISNIEIRQMNGAAARTGEIHLRAGNMTKVIKVIQREYYPPRHGGWAGSNIYWDGGKLTFDDIGISTNSHYQGVYFQWGSLWGLAPDGAINSAWGTSSIVYALNGDGTHMEDRSGYSWNGIPRVGDAEAITSNPPSGKENKDRNYLYEITDGTTGKGDICRYLTEQAGGLIHGRKWRMPTRREFEGFSTSMPSGNTTVTAVTDDTGKHRVLSGRTPTSDEVFFPASGYRRDADGQLSYVNNRGYYWSGTQNMNSAKNDDRYIYGGNWDFWSNYMGLDSGSSRSSGYSVRCVAE